MSDDHPGVEGSESGRESSVQRPSMTAIWLWVSILLAVLAFIGSLIGIIFEDAVYGQETPNWAAQAVGQDVANLIAFPVLVLLALAARGSLRAYLAWAGLVAYSVYTYAIYSFTVHFGPLFLLWVVVLGLSIYILIGGVTRLDPARVRASFRGQVPVRSTAGLLIAIGVIFGALWLSEIIPATLAGTIPPALADTGLVANPVHVLDLAVLLPAAVLAGLLVAKRRALGYLLAPVVLMATVFLAVGIVSLMAVLAARGLESTPTIAAAIAVLAIAELVVVVRFLRAIDSSAHLDKVLRSERQSA